eukprot:359170-Chlamydomonas_euryale.AAC.6
MDSTARPVRTSVGSARHWACLKPSVRQPVSPSTPDSRGGGGSGGGAMGAGRDRRKKAKERKDGPAAGKGAVKTARKTERNADKAERRDARRAAGDEDDLDAMFAQFELAQKGAKQAVVEADCAPPSARVNASFLPHVAGVSSAAVGRK